MRILHSSDWHLTEAKRFEETLEVLRGIVTLGQRERVELWTIPGDFFGTIVPYRCTTLERNALGTLFIAMASTAPVALLYGNHCYPGDLDLFARLRTTYPIVVADRPMTADVAGARLYFLPFPSKRWAVGTGAMGGTIEEQKASMEGGLRAILAAWRADRPVGVPRIFLGHVNVGGSRLASEEVMIGREVELSPADLDELDVDYAALGHIHLQQQVARRAYYCGSPNGHNFGEPDEKAILIVDVEAGRDPIVTRHVTGARRLLTITAEWGERDGQWQWLVDPDLREITTGAEVRLRVVVPEQGRSSCPMDALAAEIRRECAASVTLDSRIIPTTRVRSEAIRTARTDEAKLTAYWDSLAAAPSAEQQSRCLSRLPDLRVPAS